jgi:CHASE2 domain-containing sensor protein/signal transduction histidine kinase
LIRRRLLIEWCTIALFTVAIVSGLLLGRATARIDNAWYDVLVSFRAPPPSDRILLVTIDDPSIAALGRWPWPRSVHARMIERLAAARPAAIAYDVLFTEPGPPADDARLAVALRTAHHALLPVLFESPGHDGQAIDATPPIEPIRSGAMAIGHVALLSDDDGTARVALLALPAGGQEWLHLMEWTFRAVFHHASPAYRRAERSGTMAITIPYQPAGGAFRTVSFADVLAGEVPPAFFRDHIVLVGVTAGGLGDRYRVPLRGGGTMSGIEIQANLLNGLLADRVIRDVPAGLRLAFALLPSLLLLVSFWWLTPARALGASVALILLALFVPALLLALIGLWMPPTPGLVGLLLVYPLWGWRRLQAVDRAIGQELAIFTDEPMPVPPARPSDERLDPIGGQTARLRASIAWMRDLRRLVSDTIEGLGDPLLVTGLDDRVLLANGPATALFAGSVLHLPATALLAAASGQPVRVDALPEELTMHDGRTFSLRRSPLCSGREEQRGWILRLADISAIRLAQREREEALEFLSHDMRSPQASIIALLEQAGPAAAGRIGTRIAGHARRTLALAENFVQLARFNTARFEPEDMNLADALIDAADDLWPQASRRGVQIQTEGIDEPRYMLGERHALTRALVNLLDNAVKFSPDGGTVRCAIMAEGDRLLCLIEDQGPGIPADRQRTLFTRFGRTSTAPGSGYSSGLGLAYVHAAVKRHGGTIRCEPRTPHGTRFILTFPALGDGPEGS